MQEINIGSATELWHKEHYKAKELQKRLDQWKTFGYAAMAIAAFLLLRQCEYKDFSVDYDSQDVIMRTHTLWGLSTAKAVIVWHDGQWMTQDRQGKWHIAVYDPDDDVREEP